MKLLNNFKKFFSFSFKRKNENYIKDPLGFRCSPNKEFETLEIPLGPDRKIYITVNKFDIDNKSPVVIHEVSVNIKENGEYSVLCHTFVNGRWSTSPFDPDWNLSSGTDSFDYEHDYPLY